MRVVSVRVVNIRSFVQQEVSFQEGITLLAGDIGSGKSTILLAIDFALFGIRRGELSGGALLRHGAQQGSVELTFELEGHMIVIKRTVKRGANGIVQDFGFVSIDGKGREATAVELKQQVLDLLHYPQELLTKKSLIYRYTVYTPQEEMKAILMGSQEERLETLRKVFNIDKYKRIVENAKIVTSYVKERRREDAGRAADFEVKQQQLQEFNVRMRRVSTLREALEEKQLVLRKSVDEKKGHVQKFEEKKNLLQHVQQQQKVIEVTILHVQERTQRLMEELNEVRLRLKNLPQQSAIEQVTKTEMHALEKLLQNTEQNLKVIVQKIEVAKTKRDEGKKRVDDIDRLEVCPTCRQHVDAMHKQQIREREAEIITKLQEQLALFLGEEAQVEEEVEKLRGEIDRLREEEKQEALRLLQWQEGERYKQREKIVQKEHERGARDIAQAREKEQQVQQQLLILENELAGGVVVMRELEETQAQLQKCEVERAAVEQELYEVQRVREVLQKEVAEKARSVARMKEYGALQGWLEEYFVLLVQEMERNVLLRVHQDLDVLFQNWFQRLVENENMHVRLDEAFTPRIEQNGYDTEYENLSGGEKTAAALAYRLALNQVINEVVRTLNTRDVLILDEPTDGFSVEQIEKMRELLRELKMRQIIVVSHEPQMENFVDHIIRLEKEEHVSRVVV